MGKEHEVNEMNLELMQRLTDVYNDPEIEKRADIKKMLKKYFQQFKETQDVDLVLPLLCQQISKEYILDSRNFPKSVIELYFVLRVIDNKYDGIEWSSMQAGLTWFE